MDRLERVTAENKRLWRELEEAEKVVNEGRDEYKEIDEILVEDVAELSVHLEVAGVLNAKLKVLLD